MSETATEEKKKKGGSRAEIKIEGAVSEGTVEDALRLKAEKAGGGKKDSGKRKFATEIREPNNRIIAKRLTPAKTLEGKPLGDEYEMMTHDEMTESEIKSEIQQNRGGLKWHVRVLDDENQVICSKTLQIGGESKLDPLLEDLDQPPGSDSRGQEEESEQVLEPEPEEIIKNDPAVIEAQRKQRLLEIDNENLAIEAKHEELEAKREEARLRRDRARRGLLHGDMDNGKGEPDMQQAIDNAVEKSTAPLLLQIEENKKANERRAEDDKLEKRLQPIEKLLEELVKSKSEPKGEPNSDVIQAIEKLGETLDQGKANPNAEMVAAIRDMSTNVTQNLSALQSNLLTTMAKGGDDKLGTAAITALTQLAVKQPGGAAADPFTAMGKTVEAMKGLMEVKGTMEGKSESVPRDFPSLVVERVTDLAPEVMSFFERQQKAGEAVTKEMMENKLREMGLKMWQGLEGTIKSEVRSGMGKLQVRPQPGQQPQPAAPGIPQPAGGQPLPPPPGMGAQQQQPPIPAPAPQPPIPAPAPAQQSIQYPPQPPIPAPAPAQPSIQYPPQPPIPAPAPAQPQVQQQPQQPGQQALPAPNLDGEIRHRVNSILQIMHREIHMGVQGPTWPEAAFGNLPKDLIDRIVVANSDEQVYEAIKPWADQRLLDSIWGYISATNPKHEWYREWMTMGINWIKDAATGHIPVVDDQQ